MPAKIRIGTRGSKLALAQTQLVVSALKAVEPTSEIEVVQISTLGDRKQGVVQAVPRDKRDWIHDLEVALIGGAIDIAVHSGKDVPEEYASQTVLLPILHRAAAGDIFIGKFLKDHARRVKLSEVSAGDTIGTASLRRQAQLLINIPGVRVVEHRGNVPTRIEKLDASDSLRGIILAQAGVDRLGVQGLEYEPLPASVMLPAINQGILTVQVLRANAQLVAALSKIQDPATIVAFEAERGVVTEVKADCDSAICIFAEASGSTVTLRTKVLTPDGTEHIEAQGSALWSEATALGRSVGAELNRKGAQGILARSREMRGRR
ncbi:MAG: hydroxymethylbilane synthase [Proteobacteria bacterium]|nr:hydroxymethylbilane synthase [Pseudomonadota bacterium]